MQTTVEFNGMFSYNFFLILLLVIVFIVISSILKNDKSNEIKVIMPKISERIEIKNKYIMLIDELLSDVRNNKISNRLAYQRLSKIIRTFIFEMTTLKVQCCTLEDIKKLNLPVLYELVSDYYDPEFAKDSIGNIEKSINKTRGVIQSWT